MKSLRNKLENRVQPRVPIVSASSTWTPKTRIGPIVVVYYVFGEKYIFYSILIPFEFANIFVTMRATDSLGKHDIKWLIWFQPWDIFFFTSYTIITIYIYIYIYIYQFDSKSLKLVMAFVLVLHRTGETIIFVHNPVWVKLHDWHFFVFKIYWSYDGNYWFL
jgi:hypothetical protein